MFGLIGNLGPWEVAFILIIVLIVFGPGKLPKVAESVGKAINSFKKAKDEELEEFEEYDYDNGKSLAKVEKHVKSH
ncbi:MAG: twin-arginine translocase TatA/TatE family subunit [Syntrophomonadaceae bacterium]|nr:twin-arginine translocase TatA/TatE family subunit [Syntrophomonadaceae bacterium]